MSLTKEIEASHILIIDSILARSDLDTVSAKSIRKGLQAAVNYDLTDQKAAINELIMARFDKFNAERAAQTSSDVPQSRLSKNGNGPEEKVEICEPVQTVSPPNSGAHDAGEEDETLDAIDTAMKPSKKKIKSESVIDDDAKYAAMLQAEENNRVRRTRGAKSGKVSTIIKKKRSKKVKAKNNDDSDVASDLGGKKRKVNRSGGFHKPLNLSEPLSALLGETSLSRPQTVSKIWAYVKERDLQDPTDKRLIRCDDALRAVFKAEKVHMFTMNKVLNQHLYKPDE